jgi:succinoglycan biosynthesis transport protein ExoP
MAVGVALAVLGWIAYLAWATPVFTATATVVVSSREQLPVAVADGADNSTIGEADVVTFVELIQSDRVVTRAMRQLEYDIAVQDLQADYPVRGDRVSALIYGFLALIGAHPAIEIGPGDPSELDELSRVVQSIKSRLSVKRVGKSNVIDISYGDVDRQRARVISDAIAGSFVEDHAEARIKDAADSAAWLQDRLTVFKDKVIAADTAVQEFRAQHDLVEANGRLVAEQNLAQVNEQLVGIESDTAKIRAQYEQVTKLIDEGDSDAVINAALDSALINQLRTKYLYASKFEADLSSRLGPNHGQAVNLRKDMNEYKKLMFDELRRIRDSMANELSIAESREAELRKTVRQVTELAGQSNQVMVQLRQLERESEVYRAMYEAMLKRLQEVNQRAELAVVVARVVDRAKLPTSPSSPKLSLTFLLALILGAGAGVAWGAVRELRDVGLRNGEELQKLVPYRFLGYAPMLQNGFEEGRLYRFADGDSVAVPGGAAAHAPSGINDAPKGAPRRSVRFADPAASIVLTEPRSHFAETIRACQLALDRSDVGAIPQLVGIVSPFPGEGKTTIAANLALSTAGSGRKTLLVDADMRRPGLTNMLSIPARAGLGEALSGLVPLDDCLVTGPMSRLDILPSFSGYRPPPETRLDWNEMSSFLYRARDIYDCIVLDLPPLAAVIDARSLAPAVDSFICVVEWAKTPRSALLSVVAREPEIFSKCRGIVLNKADVSRFRDYTSYGSVGHYHDDYLKASL